MFDKNQKQSNQSAGASSTPPADKPVLNQPAVPTPNGGKVTPIGEVASAPSITQPSSEPVVPESKPEAPRPTPPLTETPEPVPESQPEAGPPSAGQEPITPTPVQPAEPEDILESVSPINSQSDAKTAPFDNEGTPPKSEVPVPTASELKPEPVPEFQPEAGPSPAEQKPEVPAHQQPKTETPALAGLSSAAKFATPELAKKEIIQEADDGGDSEKEIIRVMADKFRKVKPKKTGKSRKKSNLFIILLVVIVLIIAGGAVFYFWGQKYFQESQIKADESQMEIKEELKEPLIPVEIEEPQLEPEAEILSLEQTLKSEVKNNDGEIVSWTELYLPEGAIEKDTLIQISGSLADEEGSSFSSELEADYKIIGGFYEFSIQESETLDIVFNKTVNLKMFYHQDLIDETWEEDIVIGYFKDNFWTPLVSSLNEEINELTISLNLLPSKILAVIVAKEKLVPKVEIFQIAPEISSSNDTDSDGLTDIEETIYHTEINNPDSDADTNPDGQEILNLTDPNQMGDVQLAASGLINVYTNPTFSYSFFYPSSWLTRAIPETNNQEVLVITNTGEFFSVTVETNLERITPIEWYLRQSPNVDQSLLYSIIVNNQEAVWNPERLTLYISKEDRVYILSYNIGTEKQANFKTTFEMLINSFQFVIQPQGRIDGTLIKYPDQAGVYLIETGKKRAFASGEIFEKIGFNWDNVIEIPYSETYIDGDLITGRLDGTLVKYPDQAGVYLIETGKKRVFASGEVFTALGFQWEDVIEILADEIYPDGLIIDSNVTSVPSGS